MNNQDIFTLYTQTLNQQTQALQQGFAQMLQQQQVQVAPVQPVVQTPNVDELVQQKIAELMPELMKQAMAAASQVNQAPAPILPAEPVVEDVVDRVQAPEFIIGNKQYDLYIRIDKPCAQCPFSANCQLKLSQIADECGVMGMKQAATQAGELFIEIAVDEQTMKTSYNVLKDGLFIGILADSRENKPLRTELEKYMGQTVRLSTQLKKSVATSTFTGLYAEILGTVSSITQPDSIPAPPSNPEEATLDLGEIEILI